jgi:hypothetical protein
VAAAPKQPEIENQNAPFPLLSVALLWEVLFFIYLIFFYFFFVKSGVLESVSLAV